MPTPHVPTLGAKRAIRKIGADLRVARLRRRLPMELVSQRAFVSRGTLTRIENGDPGVSFGAYASVMQALGLIDGLADVVADEKVGLELDVENLPKRVRARKKTND